MNEENDVEDISNPSEDAALETASDKVDESESPEELKARLEKAEELANNYKIRAEKAERKAKDSVKEIKVEPKATPPAGDLSALDAIALVGAKVTEAEDIEQVLEYAKFKNIPVAEALKSATVKTILSEKAEARAVAAATNVGTVRRSSAKVSDETLLDNASKGILPDDPEALAEARMRLQKAK
ncbi:MAG: hypothetical protein ACLGJB_03675 [Blastocatellia bacterium]